MANALLDSITFIPPHQRLEIFWRTGTSKEPMNADTAWKRRKLLTKDIERIKEAVTERAANSGLSHEDAIDSYLQNALVSNYLDRHNLVLQPGRTSHIHEFDQSFACGPKQTIPQETTPTGGSVTATIKAWSQAHNNAIMCYRMYYRGAVIDPTFPPPNPPKPIRIVTDKRIALPTAAYYYPPVPPQPLPPTTTSVHPPVAHNLVAGAGAATTKDQEQQQGAALLDIHDRGRLLEEVKEHLELLKQFEGVIPDEEIASRKRELFLALPLPPPPAAKRAKNEDELMTI
jgi:hypothetical protein